MHTNEHITNVTLLRGLQNQSNKLQNRIIK